MPKKSLSLSLNKLVAAIHGTGNESTHDTISAPSEFKEKQSIIRIPGRRGRPPRGASFVASSSRRTLESQKQTNTPTEPSSESASRATADDSSKSNESFLDADAEEHSTGSTPKNSEPAFKEHDSDSEEDSTTLFELQSASARYSSTGQQRSSNAATNPQIEFLPPLVLPPSASDLPLDNSLLLDALSIYEVLRRFGQRLRLSPFRFECLCAALSSADNSVLLSEIHLALLRALLRELDAAQIWLSPADLKDSVNLSFALADPLDYSTLLRSLLEADPKNDEFRPAIDVFASNPNYPFASAGERVRVLKALTESFLNSDAVRTELNADRDPHSIYDDHCRSCHKYVCFRLPIVLRVHNIMFKTSWHQ